MYVHKYVYYIYACIHMCMYAYKYADIHIDMCIHIHTVQYHDSSVGRAETIMLQVPGSIPTPDSTRLGVDSALHHSVGR